MYILRIRRNTVFSDRWLKKRVKKSVSSKRKAGKCLKTFFNKYYRKSLVAF